MFANRNKWGDRQTDRKIDWQTLLSVWVGPGKLLLAFTSTLILGTHDHILLSDGSAVFTHPHHDRGKSRMAKSHPVSARTTWAQWISP
jgi:hypothetical protein